MVWNNYRRPQPYARTLATTVLHKKATGPRSKAKRWYVDAQIPKGVPFVGGSSFRAGSGTLTKRSLMNMIKAEKENKQKIINSGLTVDLLHNTIYTWNPFGNITIGSGQNARSGSSIDVRGVRINMLLSTTGGASLDKERNFRVMVVEHDAQYMSGNDQFGSGLGSTELFVQGSSIMSCAIPDLNRCKVLFDQRYYVIPQITGGSPVAHVDLETLKNKAMNYATTTSNYSLQKNYYVVLIPELPLGTNGVSIVGRVDFESVVDFTD